MEKRFSTFKLTFALFILSQFVLSSAGSSIQSIKDKGGGEVSSEVDQVISSDKVSKTFERKKRKISPSDKDDQLLSSSLSSSSSSNQLDYSNGFSMYIPPSSSSSSSSSSSNAHSTNSSHLSLSSPSSPSSSLSSPSSLSSRNHPKTVVYHLKVNGKPSDRKHDLRHHHHGTLGQPVTWTPVTPTPSPPPVVSYSWRETGFTDCSLSCLGGIQENIINCIRDNDSMIVSQYLCNIEDKPESISRTCNDQPCPPRYHVGEWSPCVGTCGLGRRSRSVDCKILLDFSKMYSIVPDDECPGLKPESAESCSLPPCPASSLSDEDEDEKYLPGNFAALIASSSSSSTTLTPTSTANPISYHWEDSGFTECSASCLGGTQESIIQCVRDNDTMIVSHYLCNIEDKPDSITKTCNDHPCPPRWTTSEFGPCSKPCGAGVQIREVKCIHEVTRGLENALNVPHHKCSGPKPVEERVCNEDPCPSTPTTDKWSEGQKCKGKNCITGSSGKKKRKCNKESARSALSASHPTKCNKKKKSKHADCKSGKCKPNDLDSDNNTIDPYVQSFIQTSSEKRVSLRIGGTAVIYEGTILKIRCPRRKTENDLLPDIDWTKNDLPINYDDRVTLTRFGALKISDVDFSDSGTYTCAHGNTKLSMTVQVVPFKLTTTTTTTPSYLDNGESINYAIETKESPGSPDDYNGQIKTGPSAPYETDSGKRGSKFNELSSYFNKNKLRDPNNNQLDNGKSDWYHLRKITKPMTGQTNWYKQLSKSNDSENRSIYYADQQSSQLFHNVDNDEPQLKSSSRQEKAQSVDNLPSDSTSAFSPVPNSLDHSSVKKLSENKFAWMVSPWKPCSTYCGQEGFETRTIKCIEKQSDEPIVRDESVCVHFGLSRPETNRTCYNDCPKWATGPWGECSKCVSFGQGEQTREVNCTHSSGKILPPFACDMNQYPASTQSCSNVDCRPMWSHGKWSPCSGVCGKDGTQNRSVDCVWLADRLIKTVNCDQTNKPIAVRKCQVHCDKDKNNDCVNASFLCKYAVPQSCGHTVFRSSCCKSCRDSDFIPIKS